MVHWIFILVGFAFGFFLGARAAYWYLSLAPKDEGSIEEASKKVSEADLFR